MSQLVVQTLLECNEKINVHGQGNSKRMQRIFFAKVTLQEKTEPKDVFKDTVNVTAQVEAYRAYITAPAVPTTSSTSFSEDQLSEYHTLQTDGTYTDPEKMWILKSGHVVEKVIYEYAINLKMSSICTPLSSAILMKKQSHYFEMKNGKRYFPQTAKKCQKSTNQSLSL
ncbi:hypothetical protein C1646_664922 [Rhizophagus diaphanus]|nr:hypothetical protein C1646_664922 [Rhizophagus diaphanus] [Rhizophagus sp. MUCL 43196]